MSTPSITAVFIDSREPDSIKQLTFGDAPTAVTMLEFGDVLVSTSDGALVVIERKTPRDFLGTLANDRLFQQMVGIKATSTWAYLVIGGPFRCHDGQVLLEGVESRWQWASVQGALATAQELGVTVVYAEDDSPEAFRAAVVSICRRDRDTVTIGPRRQNHIMDAAEQVLASLPGIGPERLTAVLNYCGSPAQALVFLTDLRIGNTVPGIGEACKRRIKNVLGLGDTEELVVVSVA